MKILKCLTTIDVVQGQRVLVIDAPGGLILRAAGSEADVRLHNRIAMDALRTQLILGHGVVRTTNRTFSSVYLTEPTESYLFRLRARAAFQRNPNL